MSSFFEKNIDKANIPKYNQLIMIYAFAGIGETLF